MWFGSVYRRDISGGEIATVQENKDLLKRVTEATTIGLGALGAVAGLTRIISTAYAIVLYNRPEFKAQRIASKYVGLFYNPVSLVVADLIYIGGGLLEVDGRKRVLEPE